VTNSAAFRESPYARARSESVTRRMDEAAREPKGINGLTNWYRAAWAAETPNRFHERGVEPASVLGSPALHGAFRAYLMGSPWQTDHDDSLDIDHREEVYIRPVHAALAEMSRTWPLSARYLFAIAWCGAEWQDVCLAWRMLPEVGHRFTYDALRHLWRMHERASSTL